MFLALREMRRSPARFGLLGGAVGLLVMLLLFFQSVAATLTGALTGAIANQTADVVVYAELARQNPAASVLPADTVDAVAAVDGVADAAGVVQAFVTVTGPDGSSQEAALVGIEPGGPGTPTRLDAGGLPTDGTTLASGSGFDPAFPIDSEVQITPGDVTLTVVGQADEASANAATTLYVTPATFGEIIAAAGASRGDGPADEGPAPLSWVGAQPVDGISPVALADRITAEVHGVEALTRTAAVEALPGVATISQSFAILTVQKRDALVLLRAVGARRRDVVTPVLLQVVAVGGVGAVLGSGATAGLLALARDTFGGGVDPITALTSSLSVVVLGLVAASAAVRRVLAIDPAEATMPGGIP